ncbi:SRPBCC domain-containing protein [Mycolicibacterium neoaurum]|uniref:SRPBCC domain-containing protein n=1 Tax=Mycolicibacterium neoaurum TaxID=1795 RepID=UPI00248B69DA|nr:SRPBCC domain-containing protein [Mycolicibacterium neoaurum]MDO3402523.1 SRPBCC domain-containing protein [Mycolicibacterium neoaurum]WBP92976.1 SRPBCC domain-containing protein [Mycolicibacterium neoaurum]WBS06625.1 SRPBCC domain-containing protein [Mycolicibacterium neoaurum]
MTTALEITRIVDIAASPAAVWAALTEQDLITQWFGDSAEFDPVPGGVGYFGWSTHGRFRVVVEQIEAPRLLVYRWAREVDVDPVPGNSTVVRFELTPTADGTRLALVETGFDELDDPATAHSDNTGGWRTELDDLVRMLGVAA